MILAVAILSRAQSPDEIGGRPTRWEVKEVLTPVPEHAGWERGWSHIHPLGDPDLDGRMAMYAEGYEVGPVEYSELFRIEWDAVKGTDDEFQFTTSSPNWNRYFPSRSFVAPLITVLAAPDGYRVALAVRGNHAPDVPVVHLASGQVRGWLVTPPPPHPHWPAAQYFDSLHPAGDITGDGYDDLLFEAHSNGAVIHGFVSGKTLLTKWQHYDGAWGWYAPIHSTAYGGPGDLDGDHLPDFVRGNVQFDIPYTGSVHQVVYAISGQDGSTLWRKTVPVYGNPCGVFGPDCTGDGVRDILILATYDWMLLNGTDGSVVWSTSVTEIGPLLDPGYQGFHPHQDPGTVFHLAQDGSLRVTIPVRGVYYPRGYVEYFVELDARNGRPIGRADLVEDLEPWTSDGLFALTQRGIPYSCCVGDLDGDGLNDLVQRVYAAGFDDPATPNDFPHHLAILGPQTLSIAEECAAGAVVHGSLWIPSAPGQEYRLIASTSFAGDGGRRLDGWKTHLGASPLWIDTLALPAASGTLDAGGKAVLRVDLRRWTLPVGRTIWWKAVVLRAGSRDEIHTISTLGRTKILP